MLDLENARVEAKTIIENAEKEAQKIVSESEIMKAIQEKAKELKTELVQKGSILNNSLSLTNYIETKKVMGSSNLWAIMGENRKWGVIDSNGHILTDYKYDDITGISDGDYELIMIYKDGKHGFADMSGDEIIPPEYDCQSAFYGGKAEVTKNGETYYINIKNERV